jgi:hypothetical protein
MNPDEVTPDDPQAPDANAARIKANAQKLVAGGASQEEIEAYLAHEAERSAANTNTSLIHRNAQAPGGMTRLKANVADQNAAGNVGPMQYAEAASQVPETVAAGVPGAKLAISKARSMLQSRPMTDVQNEVNQETSDVPYASAIARGAGTLATTPFLPGSGAVSGAILGGADQALNNDPTSGPINRALRTVGGAALGGAVGGAADRLVAGARTFAPKWLGGAGNAAETRAGMVADRAKSGAKLYGDALAEGQGKEVPQPVLDWLKSPDIAPIVADLKSTRPFANVAEDSPEMVDAVYKNLSDKAGIIKGKMGALVPRNANLGRVAGLDNAMARQEGLAAVSDAGPYAGDEAFMPSYPKAVQDFADRSKGIESFDTGYDALTKSVNGNKVAAKNLNRVGKSPDASTFASWAADQAPADAADAERGILGSARDESMGIRQTPKVLGKASTLLRSTDAAQGITDPNLIRRAIMALGLSPDPKQTLGIAP